MIKNVIVIQICDWEALYVDGELVGGDNFLNAERILEPLAARNYLTYKFFSVKDLDPCDLPKYFKDIDRNLLKD